MSERNNEEWISALSGSGTERAAALEDLRADLTTGLRYALRSYANVSPQDVDDFVQDALLRILDKLDTFRGESRFLTWAQKIAVHLAISELRRLRWRDIPLIRRTQDGQEIELATKCFCGRAWSRVLGELKARGLDWEAYVVNPDELREKGR